MSTTFANAFTDRWTLTVHDDVPQPIIPDSYTVSYLVYQREEAPSTGGLHWQCYIEFLSRKRFNTVRKYCMDQGLSKFHIEPARGQPSQNRAYCTKPETAIGEAFEWGKIQPDREQGRRNDILKAIEDCKNSSLAKVIEDNPGCLKYFNALEKYQRLIQPSTRRPNLRVFYLWGPPGTGKSRSVQDTLDRLDKPYCKPLLVPPAIWFEGYVNQPIVWLDDFDPRLYPLPQVLHILDVYPLTLQVKGSSAQAHYTKVYITSNVDPKLLAPQIRRRFTHVLDFSEDGEA